MTRASANNSVYDAIIRKIFSTATNAGQRLVERDLAAELGVSRVPVREALAKLVTQGILVGGSKGQGVFVRRYSAEDVRQLYEFREIVECGAVIAASERASESDLLLLSMICDEMEAEIDDFESPRWRDLDRKFHEAIASASHNQRLIPVIASLMVECFFMFYAPSDPRVDSKKMRRVIALRVIEEHREIIDKLHQRDADQCVEAVRSHMNWVGDLARRLYIAADLKA